MRKFILVPLILFSLSIYAQQIDVIHYSQLEQRITALKGNKNVLLNFWATWCGPCVKELPHIVHAADSLKNDSIYFLLVSLDYPEKKNTVLKPFLKKNNIHVPVVVLDEPNANKYIDLVSPSWQGSIPATLMIDKNGNRFFYEKEFTFEEILKEIKIHLK